MKIHRSETPGGGWHIVVLDQHKGIHTGHAATPEELHYWMGSQDETVFNTDDDEWLQICAVVQQDGVAHVETDDCDYVVWRDGTDRDYTPGDAPVPVGAVVQYFGRSQRPGLYTVTEHHAPAPAAPDPEVHYPDGVAYGLWPLGVPEGFGNRDRAVCQVRRRSFVVAPQD
ncbi:hypothetical protein [Streptomyces sp. NPDC059278]|uniref:hypothetical protein n=1 Tax=Streptomyces sp. NPDC059278 TaxID=3346801 RepID=UPI00368F7598